MTLREALRGALVAQADPERARQQQAYMKSQMPYAGLAMPQVRSLTKTLLRAHPCQTGDEWASLVTALWDGADVREERYAALEVLMHERYMAAFLEPERLPLLRYLAVSGAWWDLVDGLATTAAGYLLEHFPDAISPSMYAWARDENLWVRRTAILCQLKFKERTDTALLYHAIEHSQADTDFFARKAIGWALREYSKTRPDEVVDFVRTHSTTLSALTKREALKVLKKQGYSADV